MNNINLLITKNKKVEDNSTIQEQGWKDSILHRYDISQLKGR